MIGLSRVEGFRELDAALARLDDVAAEAILTRALLRAAEPLREAMAARAPRGHGPGPHLAESILAAIVSATADPDLPMGARLAVEVGPEQHPRDFFYGYFQEFGTARHKAQPFARPAFDETIDAVLDLVRQYVWDEILARMPVQTGGGRLR